MVVYTKGGFVTNAMKYITNIDRNDFTVIPKELRTMIGILPNSLVCEKACTGDFAGVTDRLTKAFGVLLYMSDAINVLPIDLLPRITERDSRGINFTDAIVNNSNNIILLKLNNKGNGKNDAVNIYNECHAVALKRLSNHQSTILMNKDDAYTLTLKYSPENFVFLNSEDVGIEFPDHPMSFDSFE